MYVPAGRRIRRIHRGGLGQAAATCPSAEQLAGITDCTDPCQYNQPQCTTAATANQAGLPQLPVAAPNTGLLSNLFAQPLAPSQLSYSTPTTLTTALPWIVGGVAAIIVLSALAGGR